MVYSQKVTISHSQKQIKTNSGRLLGLCRQISLQSCSVTGTTATARRCRSNGYDSYPLNQGKSLQPLMTVNYKGNRVITHQQSCQFDPRNFIFHVFNFQFYDLFLQITYFYEDTINIYNKTTNKSFIKQGETSKNNMQCKEP